MSRRSRSTFLTQRRFLALALTVGTILLGLSLPQQTTAGGFAVHAAQQPPQNAPRVDVVESSGAGITMDVTIPVPLEEVVQQQTTTFERLSLQGAGSTSETGQPEVPSFARIVALSYTMLLMLNPICWTHMYSPVRLTVIFAVIGWTQFSELTPHAEDPP